MKAKTKFMKMIYKMPIKARRELIFNPYSNRADCKPYSLEICALEVKADTELGHAILVWLGYEDG